MFHLLNSKFILVYLLIINIFALVTMKLDKEKAKQHKWRIPEKTLFFLAFLGGSVGSILGMQIFRHKTKHLAFVIGMPFILILQILLLFFLFSCCLTS